MQQRLKDLYKHVQCHDGCERIWWRPGRLDGNTAAEVASHEAVRHNHKIVDMYIKAARGMQVSALRVDVQRLSHGKRSAEARAVAAENAAQQCQQELAALRMLTASMLAQPHGAPFQELEGTESAKPGFTGEGSNSVVDTLTQQQGSRVSMLDLHM